MSEFDRETDQVLKLVRDNPRRDGTITPIGYIVTQEQAERMVLRAAKQQRSRGWDMAVVFLCCLALAASAVAVFG